MSSAQGADWRGTLEEIVTWIGIAVALVLTGLWIYFIWGLDWVHTFGSSRTPHRNWNIGLAALVLGAGNVFGWTVIFFHQIGKSFRREPPAS